MMALNCSLHNFFIGLEAAWLEVTVSPRPDTPLPLVDSRTTARNLRVCIKCVEKTHIFANRCRFPRM